MGIVLATKNEGKVRELEEILSRITTTGKNISIITMSSAGYTEDIEEDGASFEENALIKARCVCEALKMSVIADDSGLEVLALSGRPGIYSARYGGGGLTDSEKVSLLISEMDGQEDRRACFVCAAAFCMPNGEEYVCRGELNGIIARTPRGSGGFGFDPVFEVGDTGKTMAELTQQEKNNISHRFCAFSKLASKIFL